MMEQGYAAAPKLPMTAVQHAKEQLSKTSQLAERIEDVVSRIVGHVPTTDPRDPNTRNAMNVISGGVLPDLSDAASAAESYIDRAFSAIARLDKAI